MDLAILYFSFLFINNILKIRFFIYLIFEIKFEGVIRKMKVLVH